MRQSRLFLGDLPSVLEQLLPGQLLTRPVVVVDVPLLVRPEDAEHPRVLEPQLAQPAVAVDVLNVVDSWHRYMFSP